MTNLKTWNALGETDPNYTKAFDRGGYKGTSINPTYCSKKLTEVFGSCGEGWYYEVVKTDVITCQSGDVLVFREVNLFTKTSDGWSKPIHGVGGEYVVRQTNAGKAKADDEAFKKATTDALTNAMKQLGMSADIFMGEYDDNKYVNHLKEKYKDEPEGNKDLFDQGVKALSGCLDLPSLQKVWVNYQKSRKEFNTDQFTKLTEKKDEMKQKLSKGIN